MSRRVAVQGVRPGEMILVSKWRRMILVAVGLAQFFLGVLALATVDAIRIKAVESRTADACFLVLDILTERAALPAELPEEDYSAHFVAIKPPIREQIETTLSTSYGLAILLVVMALPIMMIALWPSRRKKGH